MWHNAAQRVAAVKTKVETAQYVGTAQAAAALARTPQTLRHWAHTGRGPIKPARINKRLAWPVARIRELQGKVSK
jgi:hypothetical protein